LQRFPNPKELGEFGHAFLRLMFAYAEVEREVADLRDAITGKDSFGEQNQWTVRSRPKKLRKLIRENKERLGTVPEEKVEGLSATLKRAFAPSDVRNLLVHGHWWKLDKDEGWIVVRRETVKLGQERFERITAQEIDNAATELREVYAALFNSRSAIEEALFDVNPPPGNVVALKGSA
jgi:hypothetical protein